MKLLLAIFLFSSSLFSQEKISLSSLSWLAGCWRMEEEKTISEECWMSPSGSMMLGTARTIANGKAVFFEFLQIVETDSGIFYIARPKGETPTEFQLVSFQNNEVIFEQPAHDFPQRIIYRLDSPAHLFARIEGIENGTFRSVDYPMYKISYEGVK